MKVVTNGLIYLLEKLHIFLRPLSISSNLFLVSMMEKIKRKIRIFSYFSYRAGPAYPIPFPANLPAARHTPLSPLTAAQPPAPPTCTALNCASPPSATRFPAPVPSSPGPRDKHLLPPTLQKAPPGDLVSQGCPRWAARAPAPRGAHLNCRPTSAPCVPPRRIGARTNLGCHMALTNPALPSRWLSQAATAPYHRVRTR
jgi:hypothetical protein